MKESFSLKFYLNPLKQKSGKLQLYARIIVDRQKAELASKIFLDPKQWDEQSCRTKRANSVNDEIADVENEIRKVRRKILDDGQKLSARLVKQYFKGEKNFKVKFLEYFKNHLEEQGKYVKVKAISPATVVAYNTTFKAFSKYLKSQRKIEDVNVREVDYSLIHGFDIYLKTVFKDNLGNNLSINYTNKQHSRLRTILHKAVREGIITTNPYVKLKLKNEKTTRERLTEMELGLLKSHSLSGNVSLDRVRDFFLFSCYTGLRFEDAYNLKMNHIAIEDDGTWAINIIMGKTDDRVYVPILEPAKQIITKYELDDARKVCNYVLPRYSNQKINSYLKTISDLTGINKDLTHHVARHTCATYLLNSGVPIEVVQNILGHSDLKTTKIYAKMLNSTVKEEMRKINERLKTA